MRLIGSVALRTTRAYGMRPCTPASTPSSMEIESISSTTSSCVPVPIQPRSGLPLKVPHGTMKQLKPRIWQTSPRGREEVAGHYVLSGVSEARFEVDRYDRRETLVIDPVIKYSTYFGSARDDRGAADATDSAGATYLAGSTATGAVS